MFRLSDLLVLLPLALVARVVWALVRPAARAPIGRLVLDASFIAYLVALMAVVLGSARLGGLGADFVPLAHVNPIPLRTIAEVAQPGLAAKAAGQAVGNVLLFLPLGVLLPLTTRRFRTLGSVLAAGAVLSAGIEVTQLALLLGRLMDRSADVDDVILNTVGAVLGYAIWSVSSRRSTGEGLEAASTPVEGES